MSGSWGSGSWGSGPWGGAGSGGGLQLLTALAVRENVVRLAFNEPVFFSTLLEPADASRVELYSVVPIPGSAGDDGEPTRPVSVVATALATGVPGATSGTVVDLFLDRPMTSFPSVYAAAAMNIFSADLADLLASGTAQVIGVYRRLSPPSLESPEQSRDLACPQTLEGARSAGLARPENPDLLGTYTADPGGDYALDSGTENLRKRILRRLTSRRNGFAHLVGYGVGIPQQGKRLVRSSVLTDLGAEAERQIALEPDVSKVRVVPVPDPNVPGLVVFQVMVRPASGHPRVYEIPVQT